MKTAKRGTLALAATLILAVGGAQAQEKSAPEVLPKEPTVAPAERAPEPAPRPSALPESPGGKAPTAVEAAPDRGAIERDIEKFWGKRRKVVVVQRRMLEKASRWEVSAHFGVVPNDPFVNYLPVGVRGSYHFKEWLSVEAGCLYLPGFDTSLGDGIRDVGKGTPFTLNLTLLEKHKFYFNVNATFSIIYGKIAAFQTMLSHFDLFLTAGPSFHLVDAPVDATGAPTNVSGFRPGGNLGIGMKFFINDFFGIRLDVRQYLFPKSSEAGGGLHKPTEITLGATFFI
jgi:outer membrane beta-barrel protein